MSLTQQDYTDIGTLVAYALRPTQRPGRNPEYRRVLARYRTEQEIRSAADAFLHGLGGRVLSDGDHGLVLGVEPESPLAFRLSDLTGVSDERGRLLAGLVLTGLVAYAYPGAEELADDRVRHVSERDFDLWLRELCERLRSHDAAGEVIPEQGLDDAWRVYLDMPSVVHGERGRGAGQLLRSCTRYWVRAMLGWLAAQGMARHDQTADGAWTLTERFRIHAREVALENAYRFIAEIQRRPDRGPSAVRADAASERGTA
ncbi:hypothetical protein Acsp04_47310 [Actinomadura sp. NBRC 104425]|uniref:hypothetical protein n=1 Tax=Actinomadura sp. NBRC 104425 TaxID=3032204 RepID=UPI0024A15E7B|nr:hypothetical protein [Actinomadura sp. NBRC 104425]GLZ14496.1 hypothetical protein Acsp04_47310 [Actinomadura sp. NBRC 104425]